MNHIEILNVEYGDCTVFAGKKGECLFIDCGSSNNHLRNPQADISDVFDFIKSRYSSSPQRDFLLTHYHKDHIRGFKKIVSQTPEYFRRIYLPYIPCSGDEKIKSPILDFALITSAMLPYQTLCRHVNLWCLGIFELLKNNLERVHVLCEGDIFYFDAESYEVLSPKTQGFSYNPRFIKILSDTESLCSEEFLNAKANFVELYYRCLRAFSLKDRASPQLISRLTDELTSAYRAVSELSPCPETSSISEIIGGMDAMELYSEAVNMTSIVFHNRRQSGRSSFDILMAGDAPEKTVPDFEHKLYGEYNIVKAPHHGTESGYWNIFSHMGINHMLISNGDYIPGGDISPKYAEGEYICHCTNKACACANTGQCCNKLKFCCDAGALALKCNLIDRLGKPCKIYVVTPSGFRGCL